MAFVAPINNDSIADFLVTSNSYAENFLGLAILLIVFFILIFRMKQFPLEKSFAAASFITLILAVFLRILLIIDDLIMGFAIFIALLGFTVLIITQRRSRL